MAGIVNLSVQVDGQEIEQKFATWGASISDLSPAFEQIAGDLRADFMQNMIAEGGYFGGTRSYLGAAGGAWQPLRPGTVRERERLGYGGEHPILWRTGLLARSLAEQGAAGNVSEIGAMSMTVGSDLPYAVFHQRGRRDGKMPARPIVGLSWNRRSGIVRRIGDFIREKARIAGLQAGLGE